MPNHASLYHNTGFVSLMIPAVKTADANSTGLDLQNCDDATLLFHVGNSGDTLSGSVKIELEVQESDDDSTYTAVANADLTNYVTGTNTGTVAVIDDPAEDSAVFAVGYKGTKRYVRGVANLTGTHTNGTPIDGDSEDALLAQLITAARTSADPPVEQAGRFARFKDPCYGIRAIARLLIVYYDKHDCDTVLKVLSRWAPPTENDTKAYARAVAFDIGVGVNDQISLHDYRVLRALVCGIIEHENGLKSYREAYTDAQIDKGLTLAGVEPPQKPIAKSRTVAGATVATAGVALTGATEVVQEVTKQVEPLVPYAESMKLLFLLLALVGIGLTVWARLDDRKRGLR